MNPARIAAALVVLLALTAGGGATGEPSAAAVFARSENGLALTAENLPLWKVLTEVERQTGVQSQGLEARHREAVTLAIEARTAEALFRRLLHQLKERNFAMEYRDGRLTRVAVLPASGLSGGGDSKASEEDDDPANATTEVVRVQRVLADTQAERIGLREGDFIIAYNGVIIHNHKQLIEETLRTDPRYPIPMIIARDYRPRQLTLDGGTIGVGIKTIRIFREEYEIYAEAVP